MSIVLDIIIIIIVGACVWNNYKNGILSAIAGIIIMTIALFAGNLISNTFSSEFAPMIGSFMSSYVAAELSNAKDSMASDEFSDHSVEDYLDLNPDKSKELAVAAYVNIGVAKSSAEKLAVKTLKEREDNSLRIVDAITKIFSETLAYLLVLSVAVILILIICSVAGNIINFEPRLPVSKKRDSLIGGILGLVRGIFYISTIAWVIGFLGFVIKPETIEKTILFEFAVKHNIISAIFGI